MMQPDLKSIFAHLSDVNTFTLFVFINFTRVAVYLFEIHIDESVLYGIII